MFQLQSKVRTFEQSTAHLQQGSTSVATYQAADQGHEQAEKDICTASAADYTAAAAVAAAVVQVVGNCLRRYPRDAAANAAELQRQPAGPALAGSSSGSGGAAAAAAPEEGGAAHHAGGLPGGAAGHHLQGTLCSSSQVM